MNYLLSVGAHLLAPEPEATIGPVIKAFRLELAKARIALPSQRGHGEVAGIWRNLARRGARWDELKRKLHRLRQLRAPLPTFTLRYPAVAIDFLPRDATIEIRSDSYEPLRVLQKLYEKEPRHPAYGAGPIASLTSLAPQLPAKRSKAGRQKAPAKA